LDRGNANRRVLEFYRELPFNSTESPEAMATNIRDGGSGLAYPMLRELLGPTKRVLEVGCGTGWLANSIALHTGADATAIDFNPVAIDFARTTARILGLKVTFSVEDLFQYDPGVRFDVVVSIGVLHHTDDCHEALRRILALVDYGGYAFVGLYHQFGRRPFLEHFKSMASEGASERQQFERFQSLFGSQSTDDTQRLSWFRDQVQHPHETQHTLAELVPILEECGVQLVATSVNRFEPIEDLEAVLEAEPAWEDLGRKRLRDGVYFPGLFVFVAQRQTPQSRSI